MNNEKNIGNEYKEKLAKEAGSQAEQEVKGKTGKKSPLSDVVTAFGVIGWSVITPIIIGVFAGKFIDEKWPSKYSWTLMLIFAGAVLGSYNAWIWLKKKMGGKNGNKS